MEFPQIAPGRVVDLGRRVEELEVARGVNPAERRGLAHGPAEAGEGLVPEVVAAPPERVETSSLLRVHRVDVDAALAREDDVVRAGAEPETLV